MSVIEVAKSGLVALEFVVRLLAEQFNADMTAELGLAPNGDGHPYTPGGLFMPPVARWYRQSAPTRAQLEAPPHNVTGFVGPVGATSYPSAFKSEGGWGAVADARLPFGVTILFRQAAQADVSDPHQSGEKLTPEEIMISRALLYQGALKHTLTKWGCFDISCRDIDPTEDIAVAGDIGSQSQEDGTTGRGVIYVEFNIYQQQGFPLQAKLPAAP